MDRYVQLLETVRSLRGFAFGLPVFQPGSLCPGERLSHSWEPGWWAQSNRRGIRNSWETRA